VCFQDVDLARLKKMEEAIFKETSSLKGNSPSAGIGYIAFFSV
jgi:hypothetical protein